MSDEKYEPSSDVEQSGVRFISAMRRLEIHFNGDQPIDLGPYSAVLSAAGNKGFSPTDALEAALVCETTDDVELICDYLSLSSEEKTRQYSQKKKHALSSFDEKEETRTPQKSRPRLYTDRTYRPIKHEQPNAPPSEEKKQQYPQALSSFDEVETCAPQKQRPQPSWINDFDSKMKSLTMSKMARAKKLQRSDEIIQHVKRQRHQSVACAPRVKNVRKDQEYECHFYVDRREIVDAYIDHIIQNEMPHQMISAARNKGFSATDALEAELVCGTTDDVELICDYLSLSSEEKTRQYSRSQPRPYATRVYRLKSVYFYVNRSEISGAYIRCIIQNEIPNQIIPHDIYLVVSKYYTPVGLLFEKFPGFLRTLLPEYKQFLWEHAVEINTADGGKIICSQTEDKMKISILLCHCVNIYTQTYHNKETRSYVENVAMFIQSEYRSLYRGKFENDQNYFADILVDYEQKHIVYRNGTNT